MYEITLKGTAYQRGVHQGQTFKTQVHELFQKSPTWLGGLSDALVSEMRDNMIQALQELWPEMLDELKGIAEGSGLAFLDVCTLNFVSAIGALNCCTSLVALNGPDGPTLAKTSDIGDDYLYYTVQRVEPDHGRTYLAISWAGCLWAELGINESGLAVGTSSGPTQFGQAGMGIPTQEYPRAILKHCTSVANAIEFCKETPMAGKGLNIALADADANGAVVEKSGNAAAVRSPRKQEEEWVLGSAPGGVYSTNIFLEDAMQGFNALAVPGVSVSVEENSRQRLENVASFLTQYPKPSHQALEGLLKLPLEQRGLCQRTHTPMLTHFAYLLCPRQRKLVLYEGVSENQSTRKEYFLS